MGSQIPGLPCLSTRHTVGVVRDHLADFLALPPWTGQGLCGDDVVTVGELHSSGGIIPGLEWSRSRLLRLIRAKIARRARRVSASDGGRAASA
jgi:hypothetical protein